jgi:two-component system chemotaxis sensor kinase CheA
MDDLLGEFLTETNESLSVIDQELLALERNPQDPAPLQAVFRLVHTIKGTCGFLGLPRLEKVAHSAENVLGQFRDKKLEITTSAISTVLEAIDRIKIIVEFLGHSQAEPIGDDNDLIARLDAILEGKPAPAAAPVAAAAAPAPAVIAPAASEPVPAEDTHHDDHAEAAPLAAAVKAETAQAVRQDATQQSIRVNVELLEDLMTTVSELVLTRNQLMQILRSQKDSDFGAPLQRLSQITSELQEGVMKTRMQPIGNAWSKLPRIVRDLAHDLGKKIELRMFGAETELDRQVLEMIKDPLTHMVRNSADHGIEMPADRLRSGKPETGTITLNSFHVGGHIVVEIGDDGRGLDVSRIKEKALANGLVDQAELSAMTDQQVCQFIFRAGFSTAAKVTNVSGRGVGMDVVRTNIEKIGGTVELKSEQGRGSTFVIKIPLTLAIVSALIVEAGDHKFAIPQINVVELVRASATSEHKIERLNGTPVLRLRERLLPLVSMRSLINAAADAANDDEAFIIVTQVGSYSFGIMVDRVFDTEEIVVKPVAGVLRNIPIYSGNTILGDGSVIMILDPNGIAGVAGEAGAGERSTQELAHAKALVRDDQQTYLLFRAGGEAPKAVPLSLVARLEEIAPESIEYADGRSVVQYRGALMPLITLGGEIVQRGTAPQPVLVFSDSGRSMGLVVDEIVDIVQEKPAIEMQVQRPGLVGSIVVAGKSTDLIDIGYYLRRATGDWFGSDGDTDFEAHSNHRRVLIVDDSAFFRNLLQPVLKSAGYDVVAASSAAEALAMRDAGENFDLIISDIEMPGMSGFEFGAAVRSGDRWAQTPMLALTSHATANDRERGRQVGFNNHVPKFDRDQLLRTLQDTLNAHRSAA